MKRLSVFLAGAILLQSPGGSIPFSISSGGAASFVTGPGSPILVGGAFNVPPNSQVVRFISEPPFNSPVPHFRILKHFLFDAGCCDSPAAGIFGNVVGQRRTVVGDIPVFNAVPLPFRGTLQISTESQEGISVIGLRGHG